MNEEISYLGIDIGGAHLKCVGINQNEKVIFVNYINCRIWENINNLKENFLKLNKLKNSKFTKCAVTMSAELCDNFNNREQGAKVLIDYCKYLNFETFFYVKSSKMFSKNPNYTNLISMNWHGVGKYLEDKVNNAILIDFGSTTTDFICIKNKRMINKFYDDYSRLNNLELLYTGLTRTPIFGITNILKVKEKELNLIPELFSNTSDIYRILNKLEKKTDIDKTSDGKEKNKSQSFKRISRSFGFDYKKKEKKKIEKICKKLSSIQLNKIFQTVNKLQNKFLLNKCSIILSGIGQTTLKDYLEKKKCNTIFLRNFLKKSKLNKEASFHAPALCIALLLKRLK